MKKILVNKSDEVAVIVEKIIDADDSEIILNVPRFSHLAESVSNFHLLKREGEALGKKIFIESVDDRIVELAEMSGFSARNPFFSKNRRQFSDIVAPTVKTTIGSKRKKTDGLSTEDLPPIDDLVKSFSIAPKKTSYHRVQNSLPTININWGKLKLAGSLATGAVIILILAFKILPRATVVLAMPTKEWIYNDSINTSKLAVFDSAKMTLPNQVFSQKKNIELKFPAHGKKTVERKAEGTIVIYNAYSSDPQPLVEQTRFMAPDGKIFRLAKSIVIPGAKIEEGKIVPSSLTAKVAADKYGPEYNIGPVKLFNIPGFKGTPKYNAFYAESSEPMAGGFRGEIAYPSPEDVKSAKAEVDTSLTDNLKTALLNQVPKEFLILNGATRFSLLQQKIDEEADEDGNFRIFTEAQMTAVVFREDDIKSLLLERLSKENGEFTVVRQSTLDYGLPRVDFERGLLSFPVKFKTVLARPLDIENFKYSIRGKSDIELRAIILSTPSLKGATTTISRWPFWVKKVPDSLKKITVKVE